MPVIHCTHKLAAWIGKTEPKPLMPRLTDIWNANIFQIGRKNWLIFSHNPTAYTLLFQGVKKAHLKDFDRNFHARIAAQLMYDGVPEELVMTYPEEPTLFYPSNNDRRYIGLMNATVEDLKYLIPQWGPIPLSLMNHRLNSRPVGGTHNLWPIQEMVRFLS